jgi:hypothetical protein
MVGEFVLLEFVTIFYGEGIPEDEAAEGGKLDIGHFADHHTESSDVFRVRHEFDEYVHTAMGEDKPDPFLLLASVEAHWLLCTDALPQCSIVVSQYVS